MTKGQTSGISKSDGRSLTVAGLFAGIGGVEFGLAAAGHTTSLLCEFDAAPAAVLQKRFADVALHGDVATLRSLPAVDLVTAGFPCQDISLAGTRAGLDGERSGLIGEVFRLVQRQKPEFLLLENVAHLLKLSKGANLAIILDELERLKYRWAYRVVDTRGFGLPQRRLRILIFASRGDVDPSDILFARAVEPEFDDSISPMELGSCYGFYWTEGKRGVGWARDAVPTIKGGSGLGIPSPPAIFDPSTELAGTPSIRDAERLQGFRPGWTDVAVDGRPVREGARWKMVGNAVSVPVARWIGTELAAPRAIAADLDKRPLSELRAWPSGAAGSSAERWAIATTTHVRRRRHTPIAKFLLDPLKPLSTRALNGYIHRAEAGTKRFPDGFLDALRNQAVYDS